MIVVLVPLSMGPPVYKSLLRYLLAAFPVGLVLARWARRATVDTWLTAALALRPGRALRGLADLLDALHHLRPLLLCNELHSKIAGMALEHAILVSLLEQPGSGYELARRFERSIGYFWTATHQQIYRVLKRMESDGWIDVREVAAGRAGPTRRSTPSPPPAGPRSSPGCTSRSSPRASGTTSP